MTDEEKIKLASQIAINFGIDFMDAKCRVEQAFMNFGKEFSMSEADKMLEKIGYFKDIGETFGVIRYKHKKEDYYIRFYLDDKTFDCNRISNNEIFPLEIDSKLLKAIYKKYIELGWLE